jgi:hypothetical protein
MSPRAMIKRLPAVYRNSGPLNMIVWIIFSRQKKPEPAKTRIERALPAVYRGT